MAPPEPSSLPSTAPSVVAAPAPSPALLLLLLVAATVCATVDAAAATFQVNSIAAESAPRPVVRSAPHRQRTLSREPTIGIGLERHLPARPPVSCSPSRGRYVGLASSTGGGGGGSGDGGNFYNDFEDFASSSDDNEADDDDDKDEGDEAIGLNEEFAKFRSQMSSLYDKEDEDDEDEDEDDDDDEDDLTAEYESEGIGGGDISSVDDLISFATKSSSAAEERATEWAEPITFDDDDMSGLTGGTVLLANPAKFCADFDDPRPDVKSAGGLGGLGNPFDFGLGGGGGGGRGGGGGGGGSQPSPALLAKFGLTLPPPADLGPDRRADLLPVLVLLERHPLRGCQAVLMNRRTGYLLGDLESQAAQDGILGGEGGGGDSSVEPPKLGAFMIQPLWFGGTSAGGGNGSDGGGGGGGGGGGLDMLHLCPAVEGARRLTEDGLYWGGDPAQAQEAMSDPSLDRAMSGFDFKFFVQSTRWLPMQLEKEIRDGTWFVASTSKEVLFKSRDRLGSKRAKPLWTEVMELMGGEYEQIRDQLYGDAM